MKRKDTVLVGSSMRWTPQQTTIDNVTATQPKPGEKCLKRRGGEIGGPCSTPIKRSRSFEDNQTYSNTSCLAQSLVTLFNNPELSDIVVKVGLQSYHLHKMLLMRSEVFRVMMLGKHWSDSRRPQIALEEAEQCLPHMEEFFRYFYTGEIKLHCGNVMPLIILANKYGIRDLEEACERHACAAVFSGVSTELIIHWWHISTQLCLKNLFRKCKEYMILNMDLVLKSDIFIEFTLDEVLSLIMEKDLVLTSEHSLYMALQDWLNHKSRSDNYTQNLIQLLPHIRFCMMSMGELSQLEQSLKSNSKAAGILLPKLLEAYKYHAVPFTQRRHMGLSVHDNPRLYIGSKDNHSSICSTICLNPEQRPQIISGISHKVALPISTSQADSSNAKPWCLSFRETENILNVEVSSALGSNEDFSIVESSFLIYKHENGRTFVKGVMQMRCCVRSLPQNRRAGHVFSMVVPSEALDEDSTYQIKSGKQSYCMFQLVMRHYQEDFIEHQINRMKASQQTK